VTRGGLLALTLAVLALVGIAQAQVGRIDPVSSGPVTFTVTGDDLAAAQGCPGCVVVLPDPGPGVVFDVRRQSPNRVYVLDLVLDGWTPMGGPTLEVRFDVTSTNGATTYLQTGWFAVTEVPVAVFEQSAANQSRVRVTATYRLRLSGDEGAGTFTSPVTYRIRGTSETATHTASVGLPTFLALRWVGAPATGAATLRFDYANAPMAYVEAISSGAELAPTSADFDRLEVSTNHPTGYSVTVMAVALDAPIGAPSLAARLTLGGIPAAARQFTSTGPTVGYVTLATPADFGLRVDGGETPGAYRVELRYEAVRNP
jgi:hypothetical protein